MFGYALPRACWLVNITGGTDMTLFEVDKAAQYVTQRVNDQDANSIICRSAYDKGINSCLRRWRPVLIESLSHVLSKIYIILYLFLVFLLI